MNPDLLTIQECMAKVMGDVREVAKKDRNTQQNFSFRGVDAVVNAVAPALRTHGVIVLPRVETVEYAPFQSSKGTGMMSVRVVVTYRFVGPGADWVEASVAAEAFDAGDKATAKAMSVAFRTVLLQALALPTDDLDPDAESYERSAQVAASAAPGESTVAESKGKVTSSPSEPRDAQAGTDGGMPQPASPSQSAAKGVAADATPAGENAGSSGEGAQTPAGVHYLSKDDQALLKGEWGGQKNALDAYRSVFPKVSRLADITYEMRDKMNDGATV